MKVATTSACESQLEFSSLRFGLQAIGDSAVGKQTNEKCVGKCTISSGRSREPIDGRIGEVIAAAASNGFRKQSALLLRGLKGSLARANWPICRPTTTSSSFPLLPGS